MQALGSGAVVCVTRSPAVPDCRLVEFWDMRAAEQALAALNGAAARPPPIVEVRPGSLMQCAQCESSWKQRCGCGSPYSCSGRRLSCSATHAA